MNQYRHIGLKLTPQRLAILDYLEGNRSHPSAEEIFHEAKKRFPTMSFATVYNILEALKNRGFIQELHLDPDRRRYDPDTSAHHHLICTECKKIIDIHMNYDLPIPEEERNSFEVLKNHIEFYGICADCRTGSVS